MRSAHPKAATRTPHPRATAKPHPRHSRIRSFSRAFVNVKLWITSGCELNHCVRSAEHQHIQRRCRPAAELRRCHGFEALLALIVRRTHGLGRDRNVQANFRHQAIPPLSARRWRVACRPAVERVVRMKTLHDHQAIATPPHAATLPSSRGLTLAELIMQKQHREPSRRSTNVDVDADTLLERLA